MPRQLIYEDYTMVAAGDTKAFDVSDTVDIYNLVPDGFTTVTLAGDIIITASGTPGVGMVFMFNYFGSVVLNGHAINILGYNLTAAEALSGQIIKFEYINGGWWMSFLFGISSNGNPSVPGAAIQNGTINGATKLIQYSTDLDRLTVAAARGYLIRAGAGGIYQAFNAVTTGNIIAGNGTDVVSVSMSGDAIIDGSGVLTIGNNKITTAKLLDANVTVSKLSATLLTDCKIVSTSFESGELGPYPFKMPFAGTVTDIYAVVVKAIAATDVANITLKNNAGTTMTVTTPISFPLSSVLGTAQDSAVTANNTFVAGDIITIFTAKTTAGGKALVTLTIVRS